MCRGGQNRVLWHTLNPTLSWGDNNNWANDIWQFILLASWVTNDNILLTNGYLMTNNIALLNMASDDKCQPANIFYLTLKSWCLHAILGSISWQKWIVLLLKKKTYSHFKMHAGHKSAVDTMAACHNVTSCMCSWFKTLAAYRMKANIQHGKYTERQHKDRKLTS